MQIMLVFEIQIFVHQIQPVDFWFNISYSVCDNMHVKHRMMQNTYWSDLDFSKGLLLGGRYLKHD